MARRSKKNIFTINLNLKDGTDKSNLQAYVFSGGGKPLGTAAISENSTAELHLPDSIVGHSIQVAIGPATGTDEHASLKALKRIGAYTTKTVFDESRPHLGIDGIDRFIPLWCFCEVRGQVVNRVTLPDGSIDEAPVCNARVHICEVDPWYIIIDRIPEFEIFRLRDDILDKLYPKEPPVKIPEPGPDPWHERVPQLLQNAKPAQSSRISTNLNLKESTRFTRYQASNKISSTQFMARSSDALSLTALVSARSATEIRRHLLQLQDFLYPFWCYFPYIWPFYRKDCLRTVEVDENGRFSTVITHDCNDTPDLYFWVEQLQDGVWTTVYKPSVACTTHWNYDCGSEVIINAPNAVPCEQPEYDVPDGVTLFVLPYYVGRTHIWGTPAGSPVAPNGWLRSDGLVNYWGGGYLQWLYNAPFGGTLNFYHDDSYFIPKDDTDPGSDDNSIKYYRYSYRRDGDSDWTHITTPLSRRYRMEYESPVLPTYESYPVGPITMGAQTNLFEFKPRQPPVRATDPANVVAREWLSGNINDVAASWDTNSTAPAMGGSSPDSAGDFEIKIEVFNASGEQIMPGDDTFKFLFLNAGGSTTRLAEAAEIDNGGVVFNVHVDNNRVTTELPQPSINGVQASDDCGFLRYENINDNVHISFTATHPNDRAVFDFTVKRGSNYLAAASTAGRYTETAAVSAPPYTKTGDDYVADITVNNMVGSCVNAAFAASLTVWGKATNGVYRLGIDSNKFIAFALAEEEAG